MRESRVYFITGGGATKIGRTVRTPLERLEELQASSPVPLRLVYDHPGGAELENRLHRAFGDLRRPGSEWFQVELSYHDIRTAVAQAERWYERPDRACACGCGTMFKPRTCNHKYVEVSHQVVARKKAPKPEVEFTCQGCRGTFMTTRPKGRKFCSVECRMEDEVRRGSRRHLPRDVTCAQCGSHFRASDPRRRFCTDRCRHRFGYEEARRKAGKS